MRWLTLPVFLLSAAVAFFGQTAPPNGAGVSIGHIHFMVADVPGMEKLISDVLGGTSVPGQGTNKIVKLPGVFMIVGERKGSTGGTKGSSVDHIGFAVKSYAETTAKAKAANLPVQELTKDIQAFITFPENIIVEIQEDTTLTTPSAFSHYHLMAPDTNATREWYIKTFGGVEGERRKGNKGAIIPPGFVDILGQGGAGRGGAKGGAPAPAPAPLVGTKGRSLDHIGFEVVNLKAFTDKLVAEGMKLDTPFTNTGNGTNIAFITDPNGTSIELTEGLSKR